MKKYEMIANDIKNKILNEEYDETKKLPTERQLMEIYDSSKNTVRTAITLLVNSGLLFPVHGSGIYIRPVQNGIIRLNNTRGFAKEHPGHKIVRDILHFELMTADEWLATKMECKEGDPIYYIKRLMYIDDVAFAVENTYYSKEIIPYLNEEIAKVSIFSFISNDLKLSIGFSEKYITTSKLSDEDCELLKLEKGDFGLIIEDHTYLSNGKKFNYSKIWYNHKYATLFNSDKRL